MARSVAASRVPPEAAISLMSRNGPVMKFAVPV